MEMIGIKVSDVYICQICGREVTKNKRAGNIGSICNSCRQKYRQVKMKLKAIEYKGGKCEICGYDKNKDALEFHHTNPKEKQFAISTAFNRSWEVIKLELDKCQMLCANCHRELHSLEHRQTSIEEYEKWIIPISEQSKRAKNIKVTEKQKVLVDEKVREHRELLIKNSDIDFSKYGWAKKLSLLFNITPAATVRWVKKNMPLFYKEFCFREKDIDEKDIKVILAKYQEGMTISEIARSIKLSVSSVTLVLNNDSIRLKVCNAKPVDMLDKKSGKLLKSFSSISEASVYCEKLVKSVRSKNPKASNIAQKISSCINGRQKSAYGYMWRLSNK